MTEIAITDTGIIVALIDKKDRWHEWAKEQAAAIPVPYLTCEAVITEACHLLARVHGGANQVLELVKRGTLQIDFSLSVEAERVAALMTKYENVPMDFADSCLVRMSELFENSVVFTLDSDFWIYRKHNVEPIQLVIPTKN